MLNVNEREIFDKLMKFAGLPDTQEKQDLLAAYTRELFDLDSYNVKLNNVNLMICISKILCETDPAKRRNLFTDLGLLVLVEIDAIKIPEQGN